MCSRKTFAICITFVFCFNPNQDCWTNKAKRTPCETRGSFKRQFVVLATFPAIYSECSGYLTLTQLLPHTISWLKISARPTRHDLIPQHSSPSLLYYLLPRRRTMGIVVPNGFTRLMAPRLILFSVSVIGKGTKVASSSMCMSKPLSAL